MEKVNVGIIGIGNMGSRHAINIFEGKCPDLKLVAVCDCSEERRSWAKENLKGVEIFDDFDTMIDSGLIDACIVATPHYSHTKFAAKCIKKDIHVMVEKPAGVYTKEVRLLNEEAKKHPNVVYALMYNQRVRSIYKKMRDIVHSGEYGEIRRTNWIITNWYRSQAYYNSGSWRATWSGEGGGVLINQSPHQLDLWQWICGMPKSVTAFAHYGKWHDIEVEDDVTAYVEYENGATGVFITSTGDGYGTNRFEIQLDKAKLVVENDELKVYEFEVSEKEFSKTNTNPFSIIPNKQIDLGPMKEDNAHVDVLNAWGSAILNKGELVARGEEGINGLTISNAIHLSSFLNNKKIELPFDEDLFYSELNKRIKTSRRKENVSSVIADTTNTY